jgi:phage I-like protein
MVLIIVMGLGCIGLILGLAVLAHWSDGAIIGMFSLFASIATGIIVTVRNQQKNGETLDQLQQQIGTGQRVADAKLSTVVEQTNGPSHAALVRTAQQAAIATIAELKNSGHI